MLTCSWRRGDGRTRRSSKEEAGPSKECEYPRVLCTRVAAVLDMTRNGSQLARRAGEQTAQTHPALEGREHPSCKTRAVQMRHRYLRERWTWWRAPTLPPTPGSRTCPSRLRGAATHTPEGVGQTSSHGVACGWETESQERPQHRASKEPIAGIAIRQPLKGPVRIQDGRVVPMGQCLFAPEASRGPAGRIQWGSERGGTPSFWHPVDGAGVS